MGATLEQRRGVVDTLFDGMAEEIQRQRDILAAVERLTHRNADGTDEFRHNHGPQGHMGWHDCPACWAGAIRQALG